MEKIIDGIMHLGLCILILGVVIYLGYVLPHTISNEHRLYKECTLENPEYYCYSLIYKRTSR